MKNVKFSNEIAQNGANNCKQKQSIDTQIENAEKLENAGDKTYLDNYIFVNNFCTKIEMEISNYYKDRINDVLSGAENSDLKYFLQFAKEYTKNFTCKIVRVLNESETKSESESGNDAENATKEDVKTGGDSVIIRERRYLQVTCNNMTKILLSAKGAYKYAKSGKEQEAKNVIKKNRVSLAAILATLTEEQKAALGL